MNALFTIIVLKLQFDFLYFINIFERSLIFIFFSLCLYTVLFILLQHKLCPRQITTLFAGFMFILYSTVLSS